MDSAAELRLADVEGCLKDLDTHVTPTVSGSEAAAKVDEDDAKVPTIARRRKTLDAAAGEERAQEKGDLRRRERSRPQERGEGVLLQRERPFPGAREEEGPLRKKKTKTGLLPGTAAVEAVPRGG